MELNITINLDNDAFDSGFDIVSPLEISDCLIQVINNIVRLFYPPHTEGKIRDSNGNIVGQFEITNDEPTK